MVHLEHLFAAGVRFDTEVQYLVHDAGRSKYQKLPVRLLSSARACTLTSVLQCVTILLRMPLKQAAQRLRRVIPPARDALNGDSLLRGIQAFDGSIIAQSVQSSDVQEIGDAALDALRAGHLSLLQFESDRFCRWATVIGMEQDRASSHSRALLLLDSGTSEPWACAHNARIELQARESRAANITSEYELNFRNLWGGACAVRLRSLIVLGRSAQTGL